MSAGWITAKVCAAQDKLAEASKLLVEARLDVVRLKSETECGDVWKRLNAEFEAACAAEQRLDPLIRQVAEITLPQPEQCGGSGEGR